MPLLQQLNTKARLRPVTEGLNHLLEAYRCLGQYDPHRLHYEKVLIKLMSCAKPDQDDISVIVQAFVGQPYLCTMDLQDAIEAINEVHGTSFNMNGR